MDTEISVYLASASPRRGELLDQIGVRYQRLPVDVAEHRQPGESPRDYVQRLAAEKAQAGWASRPAQARRPVLGADTVVVLGDRVMGKPANRNDALEMLAALSGQTHTVLSAVALVTPAPQLTLSCSRVRFRQLSAAERAAYWDTGEPADKAGAYGIQGRGALFVERLEGSYSGVMGLPLFETAALLQAAGIAVLAAPAR